MTPAAIRWRRAGGVLLHVTSLPGPFGAGDLGPAADAWIGWLGYAGCRLWQILPLGPVGADASPYLSSSAFAGNPLLISPEKLVDDGLLRVDELAPLRAAATDRCDFKLAMHAHISLVDMAAKRFVEGSAAKLKDEADRFFAESAAWLDDFAMFNVIQTGQGGRPWYEWPAGLADRDPDVLAAFRDSNRIAIESEKVQQFFFERQWRQLRRSANSLGVAIVGDIPIFVSHDSADVWAHPKLFKLDSERLPAVVAGVPPDYFSVTGQRWGNPIYAWDRMADEGFHWWIQRLRRLLTQVDRVRLDHFRGFAAAWEIPASSPTAESGTWVQGPGEEIFVTLQAALGPLPFIAEDLGIITPDVEALRDQFGFPGMRVLQFAFNGDPDHPYLPHRFPSNCAAYTGTHDNNTSLGWYEHAPEAVRDQCRRYLNSDGTHIAWDMTRAVWGSAADTAVAPMQDLLELGSPARMNTPGTTEGNWGWRVIEEQMSEELAERVRNMNLAYER